MLVVVWHDPLIVAGGWSYISDIMEAVGIRNTAGSKRFSFPVMSKEELLSFNPDVIFLVQASKGMSITARDFISIMGDLPIKAKNGGIVSFEAEVLLHPGPRVLESADMLIKALNRASGRNVPSDEIKKKDFSEIELTSLVDVVFQLIIFSS